MVQRHFDWGPPSETGKDLLKEWAVYALIVLVIGSGCWLLVDFAYLSRGIEPIDTVDQPEAAPANIHDEPSPVLASEVFFPGTFGGVFFVQTGAFGDEETARDTYLKIIQQGFVASFVAPDDQYEMYRIILGPFKTESEAESTTRKLNELDFPSFVVESP